MRLRSPHPGFDRHRRWAGVVLVLLVLASPLLVAQQAAPPKYNVTDVGIYVHISGINGNIWEVRSVYSWLNNQGKLAGQTYSGGSATPVLWENGTATPLSGAFPTWAFSARLNDHDQVLLNVCCPVISFQPAIWENGTLTLLPLASESDRQANGTGINNVGQVVGSSGGTTLGSNSAVMWSDAQANILRASVPSLPRDAAATAINDASQTVVVEINGGSGSKTYRWDDGVLTEISPLPGMSNISGWAINNSGQVVGSSFTTSPLYSQHAFLWDGATTRDLGALPSLPYSRATSINDSGHIVGDSWGGQTSWPFLYTNGAMYALSDLLASSNGFVLEGGHVEEINNLGQILTAARKDGDIHWVLLQPVGAATPVGTNIVAQPVDSATGSAPVTLTFANVTQAGTTSLSISGSGPAPPPTFKLGNPPTYYDISTTAGYAGAITICINYAGVSFNNPANLAIWHYDTSLASWTKLPSAVDTATTTICAVTSSLSPFAILESVYSAEVRPPISGDGTSSFKANQGVVPVKFSLSYNGTPTCELPTATISVTRIDGATPGLVDSTVYLLPSDNGANFRVDASSCQYVYNLSAKALNAATYKVEISIEGNPVGRATFGLQ